MRSQISEKTARSRARSRRFLLSLLCIGIGGQASTARCDDKDQTSVQEVRIDNNSTLPVNIPGGNSSAGGGAGLADECEQYKSLIAELEKKYAVRRSTLATALATVKLKLDPQKPIILIDNDEFEVLSVKFLEVESDGILRWTPLGDETGVADDMTAAPGTGVNGETGSVGTGAGGAGAGGAGAGGAGAGGAGAGGAGAGGAGAGGAGAGGAGAGGASAGGAQNGAQAVPPTTAAPVEHRVTIKDKDIIIEAMSPQGNRRLNVKRAQAPTGGNSAPHSQKSEEAPLERYRVSGTNIQHLIYQQPTAPWALIYEQEGDTLRQWVRYSNFTNYNWKKGTKITLSDLFAAKDNRILELFAKAEVQRRSTALQLLKQYPIKEEQYTVKLVNQNSLATKKLVLAFSGYMPSGEFRDTVQPLSATRMATITEAVENQVTLENEPSLLALKRSWDELESQSVTAIGGARFTIRSQRRTEFLLRNTGGVRKVKVTKPVLSGWNRVGHTWTVDGDSYVQEITMVGPDLEVALRETNTEVYDFESDKGQEALEEIGENLPETPKGLDKVLADCLLWNDRIKRLKSQQEQTAQDIADLTARYESYEVGKDFANDIEIRRVSRGMWESINALKAQAAAIAAEQVDLQIKLKAALYPATIH